MTGSDVEQPAATSTRSVRASDVVAVILAVAVGTGFNLFVIAVLWDALFASAPGLSENASQVLLAWGGGILSILGAAVGYRAASTGRQE